MFNGKFVCPLFYSWIWALLPARCTAGLWDQGGEEATVPIFQWRLAWVPPHLGL